MRKIRRLVFVLGFMLMISGLMGTYMSNEVHNTNRWNHDANYTTMHMGSQFIADEDREVIALEALTEKVESYIANYDEKLVVSDIFIFEDSEYYFSIVEEVSGRGAMELLVNQYTGRIFQEFGPNMMWNSKYSMHYGNTISGRGTMMGRRMMSGRYMTDFDDGNYLESNGIDSEEAYIYGEKYLVASSDNFKLSKEFHEFYGYYTFHVEEDDKVVGMLSVNGSTGAVWYHQWHGILTEVMSAHDDED